MTQTIEAVYQNGVFRPIGTISPDFVDGKAVSITINEKKLTPEEMLELAGQVYEGLSDEEIEEIESVAFDRTRFFDEGR